jgi:hypothetical protein
MSNSRWTEGRYVRLDLHDMARANRILEAHGLRLTRDIPHVPQAHERTRPNAVHRPSLLRRIA